MHFSIFMFYMQFGSSGSNHNWSTHMAFEKIINGNTTSGIGYTQLRR